MRILLTLVSSYDISQFKMNWSTLSRALSLPIFIYTEINDIMSYITTDASDNVT